MWGHINLTKKSSDSVVCLFFCFVLSPRLSLQKSNGKFQRKYHFSRLRRGFKFFQGGSNFSREEGGFNCLFPIETLITCDPDPLPPHLDPDLAAIYLVSQSAK